jgi:hypothetical protein
MPLSASEPFFIANMVSAFKFADSRAFTYVDQHGHVYTNWCQESRWMRSTEQVSTALRHLSTRHIPEFRVLVLYPQSGQVLVLSFFYSSMPPWPLDRSATTHNYHDHHDCEKLNRGKRHLHL